MMERNSNREKLVDQLLNSFVNWVVIGYCILRIWDNGCLGNTFNQALVITVHMDWARGHQYEWIIVAILSKKTECHMDSIGLC